MQLCGNQLYAKTNFLQPSHVWLGWTLKKVRQQRKSHNGFTWKHPWQKVVRLAASRQPVFPKYLKTVDLKKINQEFVMKTFIFPELLSSLLIKNSPQTPCENDQF